MLCAYGIWIFQTLLLDEWLTSLYTGGKLPTGLLLRLDEWLTSLYTGETADRLTTENPFIMILLYADDVAPLANQKVHKSL